MKHLFYSIVLFAVSFRASAQSDTITHIIERGESIEYLAERYGVAEADIRNCNGTDFDLFYTGMEIRIPMPRRNTSVAAYSTATHNSYYASKCEQADKLLNSGDYKKSIKAYSELIKGYSSSQPCTEAYYGRALAYYNRGKWKNAIRDFETVIDNTDLSENARSQCKDLLTKAKENREAQLEERGQMWAGLIGAAAMTTAAVVAAKSTANNSKSSYSSGVSSYKTGNMDYLLDPNYVNAQNEAEYQQAKRLNPSLTKEQFMQMKAQAWQATKQATSGSSRSSSSLSSSSSYSGSSASSSSCRQCRGLGKCWTCNGNRRYLNPLTNEYITCPNCTDGLCSACGGTGKK